MADLEKNILVVIPVNEDHKKFLEEKAASGDKNCCIRYVNGEEVTKEDVEQADVIVGNVDPSLISGAKNLELLQLNSAGADLYIKAGVMPEGAVLANATGAYGLAVSEHMLGLTFDLIRRLNQYHANQAEHVWKALGTIISVAGADFLKSVGFTGLPLIVCYIVLTAFINIFIAVDSAKWAIMAPIFVPMFMRLGYSPELTQVAYRIGDSSTNIIAPLMPFFVLTVAFFQKYDKKAGIGSVISTMLPYSLAFLIGWIIMFCVWYVLGLPLGPGSPMFY